MRERESYLEDIELVEKMVALADEAFSGGFLSKVQLSMVLREEMEETWDTVKAGTPDIEEVAQVAAVCLRGLRDLWGKDMTQELGDIFPIPERSPSSFRYDPCSPKEAFGFMQIEYDKFWLCVCGVRSESGDIRHLRWLLRQCFVMMYWSPSKILS